MNDRESLPVNPQIETEIPKDVADFEESSSSLPLPGLEPNAPQSSSTPTSLPSSTPTSAPSKQSQPQAVISDVPVSTSASNSKTKKSSSSNKSNKSGKEAEVEKPTGKLRSSEAIANQIKWDPRFNSSEFSVVYEDRFLGMMEIGFDAFAQMDDETRVPFHRIWMFKRKGVVVWDREKRLDLLQ